LSEIAGKSSRDDDAPEVVSPVMPATIEVYIRTCHRLLLKLLQSHEALVESQLVANVSEEAGVSRHHVQQCIYFLNARNIVRIVSKQSIYLVHLALDSSCESPVLFTSSMPHDSSSASCGLLGSIASKVVMFAPSETASDGVGHEVVSSTLLAMNPASCCEFESKTSAERFLKQIITQLQISLGISFLLAAKELIQCHGFPESVIIKVLNGNVHSSMFPSAAHGPARACCVSNAAGAGVDVCKPAATAPSCSVCLDAEATLIRLPCDHLMCDDCFTHCFLSDPGQHAFGTLPEEQTPVAVSVDEDGTTPRFRDFFYCPTCKQSLSDHFWSEFPDHLVEAQRRRPSGGHIITLDHVHDRIVANALRLLREDLSSTIARCDGMTEFKDRYVFAVNTTQAIKCMKRSFNCVADFRTSTDEAVLPYCGLSALQLSQWKRTMHEVGAEMKNSESSLFNLAGAEMKRSGQTALFYCNRYLGASLIPGSDGRCGPNNGPQCADCKACENVVDLRPTFISDAQRKTSIEEMLKDIRMCPRCFGGYFINTNCSSLSSHHGEVKDGVHVQNVCRDCGFYSERWSDWPVADERLKAQKIKAHLPFLKSVRKVVTAIQYLLSRDLTAETIVDTSKLSLSAQLLRQLCGNCLGRHFLRNRLITLLRIVIAESLETVSRPTTCALTELTAGGKQTALVLQLLQATESFSKQYLSSAALLGDSPHSNSYTMCAVLLSFAAVENWTADTLDKFITGNLGTVSTAPAYVKSILDSAGNSIKMFKTPLHSERSVSEALSEYRFSFDGLSAHELFMAQCMQHQLASSILFAALQQKFGLCPSRVSLELLRLIPVKELLQLLAACEIVSVVSALLPYPSAAIQFPSSLCCCSAINEFDCRS